MSTLKKNSPECSQNSGPPFTTEVRPQETDFQKKSAALSVLFPLVLSRRKKYD